MDPLKAVANITRGDTVYWDAHQTRVLPVGSAGQFLWVASGLPAWRTLVAGDLPAHNLLSANHGDTAVQTASRGSIVYGNSTPAWSELTIGANHTLLRSDGTDIAWHNFAWTTPSFNAAHYTADGGGSWTVASGDVTTFAYSLVGKIMVISFWWSTTSVVGGVGVNVLSVVLPGSVTAAKTMGAPVTISDAGAAMETGRCYVLASGTALNFTRAAATAWSNATNNTEIYGQIVIETT